MPKFRVGKSIFIEAPPAKIFASVWDFRQSPAWSPWLIAEPEAQMQYAPNGRSYTWDGTIAGSGKIDIVGEDELRSIDYQLTFLKPWKSENTARFVFAERDGGTEVTWTMEASLPSFMFWMVNSMTAYIGADYQRGLMMLKAIMETAVNPSKLTFAGRQAFPGCRYLGVKNTCPINEIGDHMQRDMERLTARLGESGANPSGAPFSICHKWDPVKGTTCYTLSFPLESPPSRIPDGFVTGEIPACEVYAVRHTGPYRFLGNAWSAGIMRERAKVFTSNKRIAPFEVYENDPREVSESWLVTILHFPVK
jgi:predicted transcriptional regulator YdeE